VERNGKGPVPGPLAGPIFKLLNASWAPAAPVNQGFTVTAVITINSFNTSSGTTFVGLTVALDGWPNGDRLAQLRAR
jgi:hypothetical protein